MKRTSLLTALFFTFIATYAQSKVFKEVSEGISSQIKPIWQDNNMVGYVVFTELEKASADSFNYKITIMDENLNDIGTVKFRELKLGLYDVAFEQDVLCLAYWKSNFINCDFSNRRESKNALADAKTWVFTQFLNLDGRIIASNSVKVDIKYSLGSSFTVKRLGVGKLKTDVLLKNIPQKGFACFYGDDSRNNLLVFNPAGKQIWQKTVQEDANDFYMLTSQQDVWILAKRKEKLLEGGYELFGFNTKDSTAAPKYILKDKKGSPLRVVTFDNDPATGKPFLAGNIIDTYKGNNLASPNQRITGPYDGVFTIDFTGRRKADIHENYTYWNDGSQQGISKRGRWDSIRSYCRFEHAFRDYQGNTFFAGSAMRRKVRWGAIGAEVATAITVFGPAIIAMSSGSRKARLEDGLVVKMNAKGGLSVQNNVTLKPTIWAPAHAPFTYFDSRNYYHLTSSETKTNYLIVDDVKNNITIYNVDKQKILRTIPHTDGKIHTAILPAKDGHIMVSEYNEKEKYTRVSIESL